MDKILIDITDEYDLGRWVGIIVASNKDNDLELEAIENIRKALKDDPTKLNEFDEYLNK